MKAQKLWLNSNCSQNNNWIVLYQFDNLTHHEHKQIYTVTHDGRTLVNSYPCEVDRQHLKHIYFTYMTESMLITYVELINGLYLLIHNESTVSESDNDDVSVDLPTITTIDSKVYCISSLTDVWNCLTGRERKSIGLRDRDWLGNQPKLSNQERLILKNINYLDFINVNDENQYVSLLNTYITNSKGIIDLRHNYSVSCELLSKVDVHPEVNELILYQNFQVNNFDWLIKFPNIKLINVWYCHQMDCSHFDKIGQLLPKIEVVNIHCCTRVNIRVLIPILKYSCISKLAIDDDSFWCQKSAYDLFINDKEWKNIDCPSLTMLAINSTNLTLDVIDYILTSCPNLVRFTVDDSVLTNIIKNAKNGYELDSYIAFNSWQTPNKGTQIRKKVHFNNLCKDCYNSEPFSESMLKKIQSIKQERGEQEQHPL